MPKGVGHSGKKSHTSTHSCASYCDAERRWARQPRRIADLEERSASYCDAERRWARGSVAARVESRQLKHPNIYLCALWVRIRSGQAGNWATRSEGLRTVTLQARPASQRQPSPLIPRPAIQAKDKCLLIRVTRL